MSDTVHPALKRLDGEEANQYAALLTYAEMGLGRRRAQLSRDINVAYQTIIKWENKWHWKARLGEYDQAIAKKTCMDATRIRTEAMEKLVKNIPAMIMGIWNLAIDKTTPAATRLAAYQYCLRLAGMDPDYEYNKKAKEEHRVTFVGLGGDADKPPIEPLPDAE